MTHSGNKIVAGGGATQPNSENQLAEGLISANKQLSQTGNLNKSIAQQKLSHMAYKWLFDDLINWRKPGIDRRNEEIHE